MPSSSWDLATTVHTFRVRGVLAVIPLVATRSALLAVAILPAHVAPGLPFTFGVIVLA